MRLAPIALALTLAGCGSSSSPAKHAASDESVSLAMKMNVDPFTLPNGLTVVLHHEPTMRGAYVHVRYYVGAKDDPPDRVGFAHLFEHLMFRPSKHLGGKDLGAWVQSVGGYSNGETGPDTTDYYEGLPASQLPLALWLEADRMAYPPFEVSEADLAVEQDVVKNELRERRENVDYGNVLRIARAEAFGHQHPYGRSALDRPDDIAKATVADVRAFARRYYRPNNATLVVCGAFDPAATRAQITQLFGTIPPGAPVPRQTFPPPSPPAGRRVSVKANVGAEMVALAWVGPPREAPGQRALSVGAKVLAGGLTYDLVAEHRVAENVELEVESGRLGTLVVLTSKVRVGSSSDSVISESSLIAHRIAKLGRSGHWPAFGNLKTQALTAEVDSLERLPTRARHVLHGLEYHDNPDPILEDMQAVDALTPQAVGDAVGWYLDDTAPVVVVVTPDAHAPRAGVVQ